MKPLAEEIKLFFSDKEFKIGELTIDAVIKECHELRAQISEHPTESGESFCDHVSILPTTIQLEGIISNTPLTLIGITAFTSLHNYLSDRSNNMAELAYKKLEDIFVKRTPINIATSLKDYGDMVLESLSVERGGGATESLRFRATAKQIHIANVATIKISLPEPKPERAKPKQRLGKQENKPASQDIKAKIDQNQSVAMATGKWVVTKAKGFFGGEIWK
jgi:hypothetical protein